MSLNISLLEESFAVVKQHNAQFSEQFYSNLFVDSPEVKPLFVNTNMKEQGDHLYKSLAMVVGSLRKPEVLTTTLKGLGTRHVKYGILPNHYPMVGNALLKTFAAIIGDGWTPEVKQAWVDAYGAVSQLMLEGADYPTDILNLSAQS